MNVVSFTEAQNDLKRILDQVIDDFICMIITLRYADDAVVVSLDYYKAIPKSKYTVWPQATLENR